MDGDTANDYKDNLAELSWRLLWTSLSLSLSLCLSIMDLYYDPESSCYREYDYYFESSLADLECIMHAFPDHIQQPSGKESDRKREGLVISRQSLASNFRALLWHFGIVA